MPSQLKSDTARLNGAKSRGPKTAAGLEKSSQNALKHGLTSRSLIVLKIELFDSFKKLVDEHNQTYAPASAAEQNLVDEMIAARWRLLRIWTIETALIDDALSQETPFVANQCQSRDPGIVLARAFRHLADDSRAPSLISRYEARFHRMYHRAYQTLRELQREPRLQTALQTAEPAQPEPLPPPPPLEAVKEAEPRPAGNVENGTPAFPSCTLRLCGKSKATSRQPLRPPAQKLRIEPTNSRTLRRFRNSRVIHLLKKMRRGQANMA
jgi:hypothetical protein